jgi:hypothetical protein
MEDTIMNVYHPALKCVGAIGAALFLIQILGDLGTATSVVSIAARAEAGPADSLAVEIRRQGHRCDAALGAERDTQQSRPGEPVWIVKCSNATYRIRLIPHQAGHIEQL